MITIGTKFAARIQAATLADALAWHATEDKTIFAVEFLGAVSFRQISDFWLDELEDHLRQLLDEAQP